MCTACPPAPAHPQHSRPLLIPHGAQDEGWLPGPGDLSDVLQFCGAQGRVGRGQAGAGPPSNGSWGQTWSCALTPLSLVGTSASYSLQGLFISEYNWPLGEQGAWNVEGTPLLWAWPPTLPGKLSIFLYFPPRAPKHKHPCPVCCVCTSQSVSSCMPAGAVDNHLLQNPYPQFTDEARLAKRAESGHSPGFDSLKEQR